MNMAAIEDFHICAPLVASARQLIGEKPRGAGAMSRSARADTQRGRRPAERHEPLRGYATVRIDPEDRERRAREVADIDEPAVDRERDALGKGANRRALRNR